MPFKFNFLFPLSHGLHARPATALRDVALKFDAQITFTNLRNGNHANAKALLSLISTDTHYRDLCSLDFVGPEEEQAYEELKKFVEGEYRLRDEPPPAESGETAPPRPPRILSVTSTPFLSGLPVSPGVGWGKPVIMGGFEVPDESELGPIGNVEQEEARLRSALEAVTSELKRGAYHAPGEVETNILFAHISMLEDPAYVDFLFDQVKNGLGAGGAILRSGLHFSNLMQSTNSSYLRERVMDIYDVTLRLLESATPYRRPQQSPALTQPSVCVAFDLSPAQLLALDRRHLTGLVFENHSRTSHTAILANAFGIPCVAGVEEARKKLGQSTRLALDGARGVVVPDPPARVEAYFHAVAASLAVKAERLRSFRDVEAKSADGRRLVISANVGSYAEAQAAFDGGAEAIGLFRTEFLYLDRITPPTEDQQYEVLRSVAELAGKRTVIVRTLDAGGDKNLPCLELPRETNPFLGYRAIRFYEQLGNIIQPHLRAILRAAEAGNIWVMAPMVSGPGDGELFIRLLNEAARSLGMDAFPSGMRVGAMIEVPSSAFAIRELAAHFDFFSLGTNDLSQYFFAADRVNPLVSKYLNTSAPAFLRLLNQIADAAHAADRPLSICGEMAAHENYLPLFLAMGFDELSMVVPQIPASKALLSNLTMHDSSLLLKQCLAAANAQQVNSLLATATTVQTATRPLLSEACVRLHSNARSRDEAIRELADLITLDGRATNSVPLEDAIWAQEDVAPALVANEIVFIHCRARCVLSDSLAVLRFIDTFLWDENADATSRTIILLATRMNREKASAVSPYVFSLNELVQDQAFSRDLNSIKSSADMVTFFEQRLQT